MIVVNSHFKLCFFSLEIFIVNVDSWNFVSNASIEPHHISILLKNNVNIQLLFVLFGFWFYENVHCGWKPIEAVKKYNKLLFRLRFCSNFDRITLTSPAFTNTIATSVGPRRHMTPSLHYHSPPNAHRHRSSEKKRNFFFYIL